MDSYHQLGLAREKWPGAILSSSLMVNGNHSAIPHDVSGEAVKAAASWIDPARRGLLGSPARLASLERSSQAPALSGSTGQSTQEQQRKRAEAPLLLGFGVGVAEIVGALSPPAALLPGKPCKWGDERRLSARYLWAWLESGAVALRLRRRAGAGRGWWGFRLCTSLTLSSSLCF